MQPSRYKAREIGYQQEQENAFPSTADWLRCQTPMASVKNLSNPEVAFEAKLKIVLQMVYNQVIRRPC